MLELRGKYNTALVYTDSPDSSTIGQIIALCNQEIFKDSKIRVMPDCHAGKGCVVGLTMDVKSAVCPYLVGVDIGCGMEAVKFKSKKGLDFNKLDKVIHEHIPSGFKIRKEIYNKPKLIKEIDFELTYITANFDRKRALLSLGTLGGGNHFIEIARSDMDEGLWLIIHSGSRCLGVQVSDYHQKKAYEYCREKKINGPFELSYFEGELKDEYLSDLSITKDYAYYNRLIMSKIILDEMGWKEEARFPTFHNSIDSHYETGERILRKGATTAYNLETILIPLNMKDGSLICHGKGNPEWNYSAPHGAGRLYSRGESKERITLTEYKESMEGIYSSCISRGTIDESPMAYKNSGDIINAIGDTAEIVERLKPLYNFKAGGN